MYGAGGAAAAAAAAAIANAVKASGVIIRLKPDEFAKILRRAEKPLVVTARGGWMNRTYKYMTSYKGLCFYTAAKEALIMPSDVEMVYSEKIWIPG